MSTPPGDRGGQHPGWSQPPVAQPWRGGATERPPWEQPPQDTSAQRTQRIWREQVTPAPAQQPPPGQPAQSDEFTGGLTRGERPWERLARTVVRAFSGSKQPRDLEQLVAGVQAPVTTGRRIAVTSVRGGAGKTTVSALLGSVFAGRRRDPVLAVDADPESGSLPWRLGTPYARSLAELAPTLQAAGSRDLAGLGSVLARTRSGLWVTPGGSGGQPQLPRDVARGLARLFAVTVLDCGTGMNTPSTQAVLSDAHAVVVVVPATPDGVRSTVAALDRINAAALSRVVVVLNTVHTDGALKRDAVEAALARYRVPVVTIGHDRHLVAGAVIEPGKLAEPTTTAATRLAARSLARSQQL